LLQFEITSTPVTAVLMHRMSKYFITFTPKWFTLAVAAINGELRAILLNKICKILQLVHCFVNSAHDGQSAHVHASAQAESQNSDIRNFTVWFQPVK